MYSTLSGIKEDKLNSFYTSVVLVCQMSLEEEEEEKKTFYFQYGFFFF